MKKYFILLLIVLAGVVAQAQPTPYVILVSFDGFRWDYAERGLTPNLDAIKREGTSALSFKPAYPSVTFPNHLSIITGMHPQNHSLILNYFENNQGEIYKLSDSLAVRNPKWYHGEAFWETAKRNNIKTASYFWPGSELTDANRRPDYYKAYNHNEPHQNKIDGIIKWLQLPQSERPHFITLYFHDTDSQGHKYGTIGREIDSTIAVMDSLIGVLRRRIESIGMKDSINLIILSDHGMTDVSENRKIDLKELLSGFDCKVNDISALSMIKPNNPNDLQNIYNKLKSSENKYKVYLKEDMPEYFNFKDNPYIFPIVLVADIGWSFKYRESNYKPKAEHGFDNNHIDMHGIFFAVGNKFKQNYRIGTLSNLEIYPLLCEIFGIYPRNNIDGDIERVKFILK